MSNKFKAALLAASIVVLAGCSSAPISLDRTALAANKITTIDLTSPEQVTYTRSQGAARATSIIGGGLVGTLVGMGVDGAINMNRASTMAPVIKALGNYNTNDVFKKKLASIKGPSFAPTLAVNGYKVPVKSAANVLNVNTSYVLSSNHQNVGVRALVKIKPSTAKAVYSRRFAATSRIEMGPEQAKQAGNTSWLTKNPARLKQAIESAMDSIVQQISVDINTGPAK